MTYIEFFDKEASENIAACLTFTPKRVIYLGDNEALIKKHINNYKKVFKAREQEIEFLYEIIKKSNLDKIIEVLSDIVEKYENCVFDITGGEEILNFALGIVYEKYPHKNIQISRFNLRNNIIFDCDKDGKTIYRDVPTLSIDENIKIYGGEILYGDIFEDGTYKWELNDEFLTDIENIWKICKTNVRYWNMQISIFEAIEKSGEKSDDGLTTSVSLACLEQYLSKNRIKYKKAKGIIASLIKLKLLKRFEENKQGITVEYKNNQVKRCLTVAGQALEMKIYTTVKYLTDKDGNLIYNDSLNGVVIDWDGEFHDEETENIYDTENEIDVMLMHGVVPIFISCKNGVVTSEELYKLNTVAERFGGKYAKKVLVATALDTKGDADEYFRQRAKDMGIKIIENVFDDQELIRSLKNLSGTKI